MTNEDQFHEYVPDKRVQTWKTHRGDLGLPCAVGDCGASELSPVHLVPVDSPSLDPAEPAGRPVDV